jgi:hypothetical protein
MSAPNNKPTDKQAASLKGRVRKDLGMALAATNKHLSCWHTQLELLRAIRKSPDRIASSDDACSDLFAKWPDSGKWRGPAVRTLALAGLIRKVSVVASDRSHRNRGYLTLWQGTDDGLIDQFIEHLSAITETAERLAQAQAQKQPELFAGPDDGDAMHIGPAIGEVVKRVNDTPPTDAKQPQQPEGGA